MRHKCLNSLIPWKRVLPLEQNPSCKNEIFFPYLRNVTFSSTRQAKKTLRRQAKHIPFAAQLCCYANCAIALAFICYNIYIITIITTVLQFIHRLRPRRLGQGSSRHHLPLRGRRAGPRRRRSRCCRRLRRARCTRRCGTTMWCTASTMARACCTVAAHINGIRDFIL